MDRAALNGHRSPGPRAACLLAWASAFAATMPVAFSGSLLGTGGAVLGTATAAVLVLVVPATAHAADPAARTRARLAAGRRAYEELEYRKAIRLLAPVPRDAAATRAQKVEALELLGLSWFILGDKEKSREAFEDLLSIDPDYQLREASGSPKIRRFFDAVKAAFLPDYRPGASAAIEHAAPRAAVAGRSVELRADVTVGQDVVREVHLRWRRRGVLEYQTLVLRRLDDRTHRGRFTPPSDVSGYVLEYYLEARDLSGSVVARAGGPETPLSFPVRGAAAETPWYGRWYVWVGAGALVLGTAAAVAVASADQAPEGSLPPGTVDLGK